MELTASQLTTSFSGYPAPINVIARIRPFLAHEFKSPTPCLFAEGNKVVTSDPGTGQRYTFDFDNVVSPDVDNHGLYTQMQNITDQIVNSIPTLFLSYGVTGAGKSYTLFGDQAQAGIFQLIIRNLFPENCEISAVQIYMNTVSDLLSYQPLRVLGAGTDPLPARKWTLMTHQNCQQLISFILSNRETAATQNNSASSRSHCIIFVRDRSKFVAFADLAGSEPFQPDAPKLMQQEGAFIRTSLLMLDRSLKELKQMARGRVSSASFRSSALTMVLRPFLTLTDGHLNIQVCLILNLHANISGFSANKETLNLGLVTKNARQYVKTPLRISQSVRSVYNSCVCGDSGVEEEGEFVKIRKTQWEGVLAQLEELAEAVQGYENDRENEIMEQRNDVVYEMKQLMEIEVLAERCEWIEHIKALEAQLAQFQQAAQSTTVYRKDYK